MKRFENPKLEVIKFAVADIITTSDDEFPIISGDIKYEDQTGLSGINK